MSEQLPTPIPSATIILLRPSDNGLEVLMGLRHARHSFMPNRFVFPGGRVDPEDENPSGFEELVPLYRADQEPGLSDQELMTLARTTIREMLEETDLFLAHPLLTDPSPSPEAVWQAFQRQGLRPAFEDLIMIARAITPPGLPKRFDARFFLADGRLALGDLPSDGDSGELVELGWRPVNQLNDMKMPTITRVVLDIAIKSWSDDGPHLPDSPFEFRRI
jgi:8-oxo-dGTP pyrophosphatase MutT (NUDIX family)